MSEYHFVEKPFLDQLRALGWQVIDQEHGAIPSDPAASLRTSFRQLVLPEVFRTALLTLNTLPDGTPWLAERQVAQLYDELTGQPGALIGANEAVQERLVKAVVDRNRRTGEDFATVRLIDFERPERNLFHAINQFRIDTPGRVKDFIVPDVALFVNGIPLVTVECKEANAFTANPLYEAYTQIRRYGDQREETRLAGLSEGEPRLFHFNQFNIITCGDAARFGSLTATEEYFYPWRDIYPPGYQHYTPPLGEAREQEVLIQGLLPPATLLDIVRSFVVFRTVEGRRVNATQVQRDYVSGETFLYLDRRYRLKWVDEQAQPLVLRGGYFLLRRDPKTQAAPAEAFKAWYIARGRARIPWRVLYHATRLGVRVRQVRVMELQHRWASCSAKGYLNFHWR